MIVVSDTGPLNYLLQIGEAEQLPRLYGEVLVPAAVAQEMSRERAPQVVRSFIAEPPRWLVIRPDTKPKPGLQDLGLGEQQAISLAGDLGADLLLCDDRAARSVAESFGLRVTGTLGVLLEAARAGHLDLRSSIERLTRTSFRISPQALKSLLSQPGGRPDDTLHSG